MNDQELEEALHRFGMTSESWRALPLLPLVSVAWADGHIQEAERALLERLAADMGVDADGMLHLHNWLTHQPPSPLIDQGQALLVALVRREGGDDGLLEDVIAFSKEVARAAGGLFGVGAISHDEANAIEAVASALGVDARRSWVRPQDATFIPYDADMENEGPPVEVRFHGPAASPLKSRGRLLLVPRLGEERAAPVGVDGLRIGRADASDVQVLFDAQVSRSHCQLLPRDRAFYLRDLDSTTGTWVNGQRVEERRLLGGEELRVGSQIFYFQLDA